MPLQSLRNTSRALALAAGLALAPAAHSATDTALAQAVAGEARTAEARARDAERRPLESLQFWGLAPGMTILEIQPGGGWWTDILGPYAKATGGRLYVTGPDLDDPELSDGARRMRATQEQQLAEKQPLYGEVKVVNWGQRSAPLPAGTFDFVLSSRNVHGWLRVPGFAEKAMRDIAAGLKPGGILAIEQHRAAPGEQDPRAESGYVTEAFVIDLAQKAGLRLAARSDINANPKDTRDHPFGVWTLPPTRQSAQRGKEPDPAFDRAKYDAIGESDRMTLRFEKPR
jgi:predicted methyltransferase